MAETKIIKTMRDAIIEKIYDQMHCNDRIFFLSADFGAPALDKVRDDFPERFINVGIAEQNLVNVACGLGLEGFIVYAYAITGFLSMRAYEQIRVNLALSCQHRPINVNLVGVGAGVSYDVAGPTHHCLEDISIMRTLPNIVTCSPCDWVTADRFVDFSINHNMPKYIRLDGKPLPNVYSHDCIINWQKGFNSLYKGSDICIVSTGYMTHRSQEIVHEFCEHGENIGLIDVFNLAPDAEALAAEIGRYKKVVTIEEGFKNRGGLDSLILQLINEKRLNVKFANIGFDSRYIFKSGGREVIYQAAGLSKKDMIEVITKSWD
ncbi:MAG TPA: transketolase C-terminal domain-containing protein [Sedimentisphaerales bacterium]|nr:transketolase C-terminal domain-containing protein [Sedimentisphaerales bacterium]